MDTQLRMADTTELTMINSKAVATGFNRALDDRAMGLLDPDGIHVLVPVMVHRHAAGGKLPVWHWHVRCEVLMKVVGSRRPHVAFIDVHPRTFALLTVAR